MNETVVKTGHKVLAGVLALVLLVGLIPLSALAYVDPVSPVVTGVTLNPSTWTNQTVVATVTADSNGGSEVVAYSIDGIADEDFQTSNQFPIEDSLEHTFYAKNADNVISEVTDDCKKTAKYDATAPTVTGVTLEPTEWANTVMATVTAGDEGGSGIAGYKMDTGAWQESAEFEINDNEEHTFYVKDAAENLSASYGPIIATNYDGVAPAVLSVSLSKDDWTNQTVTATVTAGDEGGSGIAGYKMDTGAWQDSPVFKINDNVEHTFYAKDTAGNISVPENDGDACKATAKYDATAPTISNVALSTGDWTNQTVTATVTAGDEGGSGIAGYKMDTGAWQESNEFEINDNVEHTFYAKDTIGNVSDGFSATAKYDATAPTISNVALSTGDWTNQTVTATVTAGDEGGSGIAGYKMDTGAWQESNEFKINDNAEHTFYAKDTAGNVSDGFSATAKYDVVAPAIAGISIKPVNFEPYTVWNNYPYYVGLIVKGFMDEAFNTIGWDPQTSSAKNLLVFAGDIESSVPASGASGIQAISYYLAKTDEDLNDPNSSDQFTKVLTVSELESCEWMDATHDNEKLKYNGSDPSSAYCDLEINLADLLFKRVVVYLKVADFAGNTVYYRSNGLKFDSIAPTIESITYIDEKSCDISIVLPETNERIDGVPLYAGDVPFSLSVTDPEKDNEQISGIKTITVTIKNLDTEGDAEVITIQAKKTELKEFSSDDYDQNEFEVGGTFVVSAETFESNHISITVKAEDYAGNTSESDPVYLAIDKTDPVVEVAYTSSSGASDSTFTNGIYIGNNQNRKATITVTELNFDVSKVGITLKKDGQPISVSPVWTSSGVNHTCTVDFANYVSEHGNQFEISTVVTDLAGNTTEGFKCDNTNPTSFVIDNTKPVISVNVSNSDVRNGKYFKASRRATITITERFFSPEYLFNWSGLTYSINGQSGSAPSPVLTSSNDTTYIRVYTVDFTADGDYTFDVQYTDLSGNVCDGFSCSSAAYREFTIDTTAPELTIGGVANRSANKDEVVPLISYSDINLDPSTVFYALSGANNGSVDYAHEESAGAQSGTITYMDFERVQSVDDIYTLTATVTDLAGNETTATILFSANRFGSTYDLQALADINGKFLKEGKDLHFTEINVDALQKDTVKLKLTKNGTPIDLVENRDYTVVVLGGGDQWYRNQYVVNKSLFADDGRYSLSVYSVDVAGNVNENIDEAKKAEISFGIDKTDPVVVPIDLESGKQYAVASKTVSVEIKDNLILEKVKIYLNDQEIDYSVDGEVYTFAIPEGNEKQTVRIIAVDAAGNERELFVESFLVSSNFFIRWYNNTPLFIGSIAGIVALIAAPIIGVGLVRRRRRA